MMFRATKQAWLANGLVFAFPILLLSVPRGAGVFIAAVVLAVLQDTLSRHSRMLCA